MIHEAIQISGEKMGFSINWTINYIISYINKNKFTPINYRYIKANI